MTSQDYRPEDLYCGDCLRFDSMPIAAVEESDPLGGRCPYREKVNTLDEPCPKMVSFRAVLALVGGREAVERMTDEEAARCVNRARDLLKAPQHLVSLAPEEIRLMLRAGLFFRERLARLREERARRQRRSWR